VLNRQNDGQNPEYPAPAEILYDNAAEGGPSVRPRSDPRRCHRNTAGDHQQLFVSILAGDLGGGDIFRSHRKILLLDVGLTLSGLDGTCHDSTSAILQYPHLRFLSAKVEFYSSRYHGRYGEVNGEVTYFKRIR